jgi:hypothetical protein
LLLETSGTKAGRRSLLPGILESVLASVRRARFWQCAGRPSVPLLAAVALAASGCGAAPDQAAVKSVNEHKTEAVRAQLAIREAEAQLDALPVSPTRAGLRRLRRAARIARERINEVRLRTYESPEEELPTAESEAAAGANELNQALSVLVSYTRHPHAASLVRYRQYMNRGREEWNQAMTELWRLAGESRPPIL